MSNLDYPISVLTEERDNIHGLPKNRVDKLQRAIDILNEVKMKDEKDDMSKKSIHKEGAVPLHAIKVLEDELKSLKRQRDTSIFQKSYSMRYSGQEIGELETAIKILK